LIVILHTLNASPASPAFGDCLKVLTAGDAVLLMGDGVYAVIEHTSARAALLASGAEIHVLSADASAAGIEKLPSGSTRIGMDGFVALSERFPRQQAWY
jgi:sulfur relay protein TusB/DsrH